MILLILCSIGYALGVLFFIFTSFLGAGDPIDWLLIFFWPVYLVAGLWGRRD